MEKGVDMKEIQRNISEVALYCRLNSKHIQFGKNIQKYAIKTNISVVGQCFIRPKKYAKFSKIK
jgi:hypothetical protein